jgi:hypothetical protein
VVDDMSSLSDRREMLQRYPMIRFIMKTVREKGHAKSLNILVEEVTTRCVFAILVVFAVNFSPISVLCEIGGLCISKMTGDSMIPQLWFRI